VQSTARIEEVQPLGGRRLRLTFSPRLTAEIELTAEILKDAPVALGDPAVFQRVEVTQNGQLAWPGGYTLDADTLYQRARATAGLKGAAPASGASGKGEKGEKGEKAGVTIPALLGTILSGLGVLGFVTFAGGVVLWSRFNEMGIPADHALGLVPKSELVSTGADFLVPAMLFSIGAVVLVVVVGSTIDYLIEHFNSRKWPPTRWLVAPVVLGLTELAFALKLEDKLPSGAILVLVLVAGLGALTVSSAARVHLAAFALATFLAVGSFAIARTYELTTHDLKVLPMAYSRTQPGEATRVEVGYFVAETSDRILFASVPKAIAGQNAVPNELREFPREETDDLEIGELARPKAAEAIASRFAYNLCVRLAHLTPATPSSGSAAAANGGAVAPTTKPVAICPRSYLKELATKAGVRWQPDRAELLAGGLHACKAHEHSRRARVLCERRMRKRYGTPGTRRGSRRS
jgi:hypothetical protein